VTASQQHRLNPRVTDCLLETSIISHHLAGIQTSLLIPNISFSGQMLHVTFKTSTTHFLHTRQSQHYAASWTTLCHFLTTCSRSWLCSKRAIPSLCTKQSINRSINQCTSQSSFSASIHLQRICALHIQGTKSVTALKCFNFPGFTNAKASEQISNNALHPWTQFYYWISFNFTDKRKIFGTY
jgi:hypothetical protein